MLGDHRDFPTCTQSRSGEWLVGGVQQGQVATQDHRAPPVSLRLQCATGSGCGFASARLPHDQASVEGDGCAFEGLACHVVSEHADVTSSQLCGGSVDCRQRRRRVAGGCGVVVVDQREPVWDGNGQFSCGAIRSATAAAGPFRGRSPALRRCPRESDRSRASRWSRSGCRPRRRHGRSGPRRVRRRRRRG